MLQPANRTRPPARLPRTSAPTGDDLSTARAATTTGTGATKTRKTKPGRTTETGTTRRTGRSATRRNTKTGR
jgi:hypothetical protein